MAVFNSQLEKLPIIYQCAPATRYWHPSDHRVQGHSKPSSPTYSQSGKLRPVEGRWGLEWRSPRWWRE